MGSVSKSHLWSPTDIGSLLILVAMEVEEKSVLQHLCYEDVTVSDKFNIQAKLAVVKGKQIWVLKTGVGLVNAAVATALLLERHPVDAIILLGIGGSLSDKLKMGDLVAASQLLQHDSVMTGDSGSELMFPGRLFLSIPGDQRPNPNIPTHFALREWVKSLVFGQAEKGSVYEGTILSGSEFAGSTTRKRELANRIPEALLVEMEATGIAQVALKSKTPFVVFKTVADAIAPEQGVTRHYRDVLEAASAHAGEIARNIVKSFEGE